MRLSAWRRRRWGVIILIGAAVLFWLFNVSKPGRRPSGCLRDCAAPLENRDGPLKIVTWNILHGFPDFADLTQRLDLIVETLQEQGADIVLLQEVPQTLRRGSAAAYLAEHLEMNYVYARANGNKWAIFFEEGEAVLSRFPLTDPQVWELSPQAAFFEHRIVLSADVITAQGVLTVYATHLTNGEAATNQDQAADLASIVSRTCDGVCLIGGDFNAQSDSAQIGELKTIWKDSADVVDGPGYTCCLDPEAPVTAQLSKRIDYLFLSMQEPMRAEILEAQTIPAADRFAGEQPAHAPSDHLGVWVVFRLR